MLSLRSFLLLPAFALFLSPACAQDVATINAGPAPKDIPSTPAWGYWKAAPTAWIMTHNGMLMQTKKGGIDIIFLGDSITANWLHAGKTVWDSAYVPLKAADYGIGGDTTRQIIWRIDHGEFDGLTPKLVVLMIGTNNLYADTNSGTNEEITAGVRKIIDQIKAKTPTAKILLLGILPRQTKIPWCDRILKLNLLLANLATTENVKFLDVSKDFLDSEGKAKVELFSPDLVHPNTQGYEVLNTSLKPSIDDLLK